MPIDTPTVSVVIATFNGAAFIEEQLRSLLGQSRPAFEIIVSDDGSEDDTVKRAKILLESGSLPFRIIQNPVRLGFRDNFLCAALSARGDVVAFCDQDDVWHPRKLEACAGHFADPSVAMVAHAATTIDGEGNPIGRFDQGIARTGVRPPLSYDPWQTFFGFSMLFRRSLLDIADTSDRFIDFISPGQQIAHDRWIMFLAQMLGRTMEIAEPLVQYRQHGRNTFGSSYRRDKATDLRIDTEIYLAATRKMLTIVQALPDSAVDVFPAFDRVRCERFLSHAVAQLTMRRSIYENSSIPASLAGIFSGWMEGKYRAAHTGQHRWHSIGRDLQFTFLSK